MERNQRVIEAFINCVQRGVYQYDYAVTLLEDSQRYPYLTDEDKELFYETVSETEDEE